MLERKRAFAAIGVIVALIALPVTVRADAPGQVEPALDRLQASWNALHGYSVMIDAHEVLGSKVDDHQLHYSFVKPNHAELDVVGGTQTGATIVWNGGDRLTFYRRGLSFFKMHAGLHDKAMTSLRGNTLMMGNLGDVLTCFTAHRDLLTEADGPDVDGAKTSEIRMNDRGISCADDPTDDRNVTLDVIDISKASGLVVERRRYEGTALVERWDLSGYKLDPAATPAG
jgi:hypothetical protein